MEIAANRLAEVDHAYMYFVKAMPYLPHYTKKGIFVAPGGLERTEAQILAIGGVKKATTLWPRAWQKK
jgi:hypothetical protein